MRDKCIDEIATAIGRKVAPDEADAIERTVRDTMARLARADPKAWGELSMAERLQAAAMEAERGMLAQAAKSAQRVTLNVQAATRNLNRLDEMVKSGRPHFKALARVLHDADRYVVGVRNEYFSELMDTINAVEPRFFGLMENAEDAAALVRELFANADGSTGNKIAQQGAKVWLEVAEKMRVRFNAAGGDVGKLDAWRVPQPHDQGRVARAGVEQWVESILPKLDRTRYIDPAGVQVGDDVLRPMLHAAWETISSGGVNKLEPGAGGRGKSFANKHSDHRVLHFKDADAYIDYMREYGRGGVFSSMQSHVSVMARDIALTEAFGPNPTQMFKVLQDTAKKAQDGADLSGPWLVESQDLWDSLSGKTGIVANERMAQGFQGARNVEVFGKLGRAFLSSVTDVPTYFITSGYHKLPILKTATSLIKSFGGDTREYANRSGLMAESIVSDMNRWAEGHIGHGWTSKLANLTMKASLLEAWTDGVRRAFQVNMMGALGKMTRTDWGALDAGDRFRLQAGGITETDFKVWQLATPEQRGNSQMLSRNAMRAITPEQLDAAGLKPADLDRATGKLLGYIVDESHFASLAQDLSTRAAVTRGTQKGTVKGELLRSVALFKGFPMAMISRHWGRMTDLWRNGDKALSVGYGAGLTSALTVFGALAIQLKDMADGKDPRQMDSPKFWTAAFMQGGGAGIFGDLVYQLTGGGRSQTGQSAAASAIGSFLGPVVGTAAQAADLTLGNLVPYLNDRETHFGAEAVTFARGHTPFIGLWWAKGAVDRMVLHDLQETLSPGYLGKMQGRAMRDWGQGYWAPPGELIPERAPDFESVFGRQ